MWAYCSTRKSVLASVASLSLFCSSSGCFAAITSSLGGYLAVIGFSGEYFSTAVVGFLSGSCCRECEGPSVLQMLYRSGRVCFFPADAWTPVEFLADALPPWLRWWMLCCRYCCMLVCLLWADTLPQRHCLLCRQPLHCCIIFCRLSW
jgi:hypothetical protein